jgi:putative ABC transport system permease protein
MLNFESELRLAFRQLLRSPGFTAVVILTLALGVGANTAIFSFVNGVLLRPLPYPEPERLVEVCETHPERPSRWCGASPANWADWLRMSRTLESVGLARYWPFSLKRADRTLSLTGGVATPGLFQVFRVHPAMGRVFEPRDIEPGSEHVVLISHDFWLSTLGGTRDALGQRLAIDGKSYEIIGVLPPKFDVPQLSRVDAWIPLWPERRNFRAWRGFRGYARLHPKATLEQAAAEMQSIHAQLAEQFPDDNKAWGVRVASLHESIVGQVKPALLLFLAAVVCVLLIACANVANLFLSRGAGRAKEFAVRLALGASRWHLARQLFVESLLYALLGGAAGVLLAIWIVDVFRALAPAWLPRLEFVRLGTAEAVFAAGISLAAGLLFGMAPILQSRTVKMNESLHEGRSGSASRRDRRVREWLVVSEIALACVLLVCAGLLLRSFVRLLDWQPGFDRENLTLVQVFSSPGKYPQGSQVAELYARAAAELATLPGVASVGAGSAGPLFGGDGESEFYVEGRPRPETGKLPVVAWYDVNPNYFHTLAIPLMQGRVFTDSDRSGAPLVAIINRTMAERFWPGQSPIGQRVHLVLHDATFEIVGVVGNVQPFRPDRAPQPEIYWPFAQAPRWAITFFIRTSMPPEQAASAIRARLAQVDSDMSLGRIWTMDELVNRELTDPRFSATLVGIFAALATVIAMVGVYGVMSLSVTQRRHEMGVRLALGAARGDIIRLIMRRGVAMAMLGLAAGLLGAVAAGRWVQSQLIGVSPADPSTFAGIGLLVIAVSSAACYFPARRATRTDPLVALRCE